jgi:NADH-quinone oxidoreductase subunit M
MSSYVLVALLALPLAGLIVLLVLPADVADRIAVRVGLVASGAALAVTAGMLAGFNYARAESMQMQLNRSWAPSIGLRFHLGVDGISLPLVVLTALLTFCCLIYTTRSLPSPGRPRSFVALVLLLEVGMLGTFVALDLVLFFVAFEVVLIPMYALIAAWGGPQRRHAATKFILYTLLGSAFMLTGFLIVYAETGTLDMVELAARHGSGITHGVQALAFAAMFIGFAIKTPMWPLHTWLPDAHTEAPTVGSVLLAGVLLKMGTYGLIRIAIAELPHGAQVFAPWLGAFAVVGIVYGALACLAQRDLKRLIAFSSVGHMGFVLLGIATLTPLGINAALFGNIAHGLITGLLFFVVGGIKDRWHTSDMRELGSGLLTKAPHLGAVLTFGAIASLGLPGLAGFWGEVLAMLGAFKPAAELHRGLFWLFMAVAGAGTVLTAAYLLVMLRRVNLGRVAERWRDVRILDLGVAELAAWTPLIVLTLVVGLWPRILLGVTDAAARALLGGG